MQVTFSSVKETTHCLGCKGFDCPCPGKVSVLQVTSSWIQLRVTRFSSCWSYDHILRALQPNSVFIAEQPLWDKTEKRLDLNQQVCLNYSFKDEHLPIHASISLSSSASDKVTVIRPRITTKVNGWRHHQHDSQEYCSLISTELEFLRVHLSVYYLPRYQSGWGERGLSFLPQWWFN